MTLDELAAGVQPAAVANNQKSDFWGSLGAGGWSALNEAGLGLPEFLLGIGDKVAEGLGSKVKAADVIKGLQESHQGASDVGKVAGTVGSLFIPGGAITKGVGAGLKGAGALTKLAPLTKGGEALTKAGEFLGKTGAEGNAWQKLGQYALRGAGQAAEQTVPRVLTGNMEASDAPLSVAAGGAAGAVLGPLASKLLSKGNKQIGEFGENPVQFALGETKEFLNKQTARDLGLEPRSMMATLRGLGWRSPRSATLHGEDFWNDWAQQVRDYGIKGEREWKGLLDKNLKEWDAADDLFAKNAPADWNQQLIRSLVDDQDLVERITSASVPEAAKKQLENTIETIGKAKDISTVRQTLGNVARDNLTSPNPADRVTAQIAFAAKEKVDNFLANTVEQMGVDVKGMKERYKILQPFMIQERRELSKLPKAFDVGSTTMPRQATERLLGGGALGGLSAGADIAQGNDIDVGRAAASAAGGVLGGPLFAKLLTAAGNKAVGKGARAAADILEKKGPEIEKLASSGVQAMPSAGSKGAASVASNIPEGTDMQPEAGTIKEPPAQTLPPQFQAAIQQQMAKIYNQAYRDMDPQDFVDRVRAKTKGFTDINAMAAILYPDVDKRRSFLQQLNAYQSIRDVDLLKAAKGKGGIFDWTKEGAKNQEARDRLIEAISGLDSKTVDFSRKKKEIEKDLNVIRDNPNMLANFARKYGLDFQDLQELGFVGGGNG